MEAEGFVVLPGVVPDVLMDNVVSDARSRLKDRGCVKRQHQCMSQGVSRGRWRLSVVVGHHIAVCQLLSRLAQ